MKDFDYEEKKIREMAWHEQKLDEKATLVKRVLHHPLFFEPSRNSFNYVFPKEQVAKIVESHLKGKVDRLLIAPCGYGDDLKYLGHLANEACGIDLSPVATAQCPSIMKVKVGDILDSGYPNEVFDLVASILFFHHLLNIGFESFLKEFHRILKSGGKLVILEPSVWYPINIITRPMKRILRNPYGEVEDEGPFDPRLMLRSLRRAGFINIEMRAATFSHCSFYVPLAKLVNRITKPLLNTWPCKYFGWMVVYWAEKNSDRLA